MSAPDPDLDPEWDAPAITPMSPLRSTLLFAVALLLIAVGAAAWMAALTSLAAGVAVFLVLFTCSLFLLIQYHAAVEHLTD